MSIQPEKPKHPKGSFKSPLLFSLIAFFVFLLDQCTKFFAAMLPSSGIGLPGFITLRPVENTGAAFSIAAGQTVFFIVFALVVVAALIFYAFSVRPKSLALIFACALVVGGAIGNVIDRICEGAVTDFISLDFIGFPIFNVADIAIVIGFLIGIIYFARKGI